MQVITSADCNCKTLYFIAPIIHIEQHPQFEIKGISLLVEGATNKF